MEFLCNTVRSHSTEQRFLSIFDLLLRKFEIIRDLKIPIFSVQAQVNCPYPY